MQQNSCVLIEITQNNFIRGIYYRGHKYTENIYKIYPCFEALNTRSISSFSSLYPGTGE